MKINTIQLLAGAALLGAALLPVSASAQGINERLHDQHGRIHQGVTSGQLTRGEQHQLNHRDALIHAQEHVDRRFDHGHLTAGERRGLDKELNGSSRAIYRDKHNAAVR